MEKLIRLFHSFDEADAHEVEEDMRMTPQERIGIVLELRERMYPDAAEQGLARVYRFTKLERG